MRSAKAPLVNPPRGTVIRFDREWRVPSVERATEGRFERAPTRNHLRRIKAEAHQAAASWVPGEAALALLARVRSEAVGRAVVIQVWDPIMFMLEDEGPFPMRATCRGALTEITAGGHQQAFLDLADLTVIASGDGYDGRAKYLRGPEADGSYLLSLAHLYEVTIE